MPPYRVHLNKNKIKNKTMKALKPFTKSQKNLKGKIAISSYMCISISMY